MRTSRRTSVMCLASMALVLALIATAQFVLAQEQGQEPQLPRASKEHQLLQQDVGTWDATIRIWPAADAEPMESKGTETNELLPGGLWLVSRFKGEVIGVPFAGLGTVGYDPVEKKYVGTWVDTISPHLMTMKGDYDAATKTMTATAEGRDFETREITKSKHISRYIDDNTRSFEIHTDKDGTERKVMEIQYKRRAK